MKLVEPAFSQENTYIAIEATLATPPRAEAHITYSLDRLSMYAPRPPPPSPLHVESMRQLAPAAGELRECARAGLFGASRHFADAAASLPARRRDYDAEGAAP